MYLVKIFFLNNHIIPVYPLTNAAGCFLCTLQFTLLPVSQFG